MDDVTALRDALLSEFYETNRYSLEWLPKDSMAAGKRELRARLDALIAAVEARAALTPERLARAIHHGCEAEWDRKAAHDPQWQGTMHSVDAHRGHALAILAALATDEAVP